MTLVVALPFMLALPAIAGRKIELPKLVAIAAASLPDAGA